VDSVSDSSAPAPATLTWHFPRTFWVANGAELLERAAYYGMFIALALYLTDRVKFTDIGAGYVAACFASVLYLLPMFTGALADRIGFRRALLLAFSLLAIGYFVLGASQQKLIVIFALMIIMVGGAMVKPVISGTAAKCSDEAHRPRAFSIFYLVVNIGAFLGKTVAKPLRTGFRMPYTDWELSLGLEYINFYASLMALLALLFVALFYRNVGSDGAHRTFDEILAGLGQVFLNGRFMCLIVIVAGFWTIQGQLYASMPKYILRVVSPGASPEWLANINPLVVVLLVVPITHLVRRFKPASSIGIALGIVPLAALSIALSPVLQARFGNQVEILSWLKLHPVTVMAVCGIALLGLAECFLSPKYYEFASRQAPKGQVGMYMGYQSLATFIAWAFGFSSSGYLLTRFCPDPKTLPPEAYEQWQVATSAAASGTAATLPEVYAHAHYLWYAYAAVGFLAFIALLVFKFTTDTIDRRRERAAELRAASVIA
jgi:dipeptide/tripeptide permease